MINKDFHKLLISRGGWNSLARLTIRINNTPLEELVEERIFNTKCTNNFERVQTLVNVVGLYWVCPKSIANSTSSQRTAY